MGKLLQGAAITFGQLDVREKNNDFEELKEIHEK